jgi:hypothetical protein
MLKQKFKEWLKRYLPAEIAGTLTAISVASIVHFFYSNHVLIAYAGSLGEAIGFYSTIFIQHTLKVSKKHTLHNTSFSFSDFSKIIATIILEFGPAGLIDGLLLRPFFMYVFPMILKNFTLGILVGKLAGDFTFYLLVIFSYEIKKQFGKYKK